MEKCIIFVITPTYSRPERLADMTRFSQTLSHIKDLIWIVVEDGEELSVPLQRLLKRSRIRHVYLKATKAGEIPGTIVSDSGDTQRNFGLDYLRKTYANYKGNAVVYLADDDNSYDTRLFNKYIRKVRTIGIWAVGFSGAAKVEAPHVENKTVTKWDVLYLPGRKFAVDMAAFAINLKLILKYDNASFGPHCHGREPEDCFLSQFNIPKEKVEPFGFDDDPKDILVWHTKTEGTSPNGDDYGYVFELRRPPPPEPTIYIRPESTIDIDCSALFNGSSISNYSKNRVTYNNSAEKEIPTDCDSIKSRNYFQTENLYAEEAEFPIAFARSVFRDYRFLEMELASTYALHNFYCYAIDAKSPPLFREQMKALTSCFPNVMLTTTELNMDSSGTNIDRSLWECAKTLSEFKWQYVIFLQNYDIAIKTNQEMIKIFKLLNGTNDVAALKTQSEEALKAKNWTIGYLNLLQNPTPSQNNTDMEFAKSPCEISLSRAAIDFILKNMNLNEFMDKLGNDPDSIYPSTQDELMMGTLNAMQELNIPGGFTQHCLKKGIEVRSFTRKSYWMGGDECVSGIERHDICIIAAEHLPELLTLPHLYINKFMPKHDFGALTCWLEMLHHRTHLDRDLSRLNENIYLKRQQVRYQQLKNENGVIDAQKLESFECNNDKDIEIF